jgi:hypothetical protein
MTEDPDDQPADANGVLSSLPGTRPQRRSPKRAATKPARRAPAGTDAADPINVAAPTEPQPLPTEPQPPSTEPEALSTEPEATPAAGRDANDKPRPTRSKPPGPKAAPPRTTRPTAAQGFQVDPIEGAVDPPTGAEILSSVAQGAIELAELGLALTRRLARSVLDRLPRL